MVTEPKSMDELVYMTTRMFDDALIRVWVYRQKCPKCKKSLMGKPLDDKTGKIKVRSSEYVCPSCGYSAEKKAYEDTLEAEFKGTCPHCKKDIEGSVPFKRKSVKGVSTLRIKCPLCSGDIDITKKMKKLKD